GRYWLPAVSLTHRGWSDERRAGNPRLDAAGGPRRCRRAARLVTHPGAPAGTTRAAAATSRDRSERRVHLLRNARAPARNGARPACRTRRCDNAGLSLAQAVVHEPRSSRPPGTRISL